MCTYPAQTGLCMSGVERCSHNLDCGSVSRLRHENAERLLLACLPLSLLLHDHKTHPFLVSCLYWALEPEGEILMFMWSFGPLYMTIKYTRGHPIQSRSALYYGPDFAILNNPS